MASHAPQPPSAVLELAQEESAALPASQMVRFAQHPASVAPAFAVEVSAHALLTGGHAHYLPSVALTHAVAGPASVNLRDNHAQGVPSAVQGPVMGDCAQMTRAPEIQIFSFLQPSLLPMTAIIPPDSIILL